MYYLVKGSLCGCEFVDVEDESAQLGVEGVVQEVHVTASGDCAGILERKGVLSTQVFLGCWQDKLCYV